MVLLPWWSMTRSIERHLACKLPGDSPASDFYLVGLLGIQINSTLSILHGYRSNSRCQTFTTSDFIHWAILSAIVLIFWTWSICVAQFGFKFIPHLQPPEQLPYSTAPSYVYNFNSVSPLWVPSCLQSTLEQIMALVASISQAAHWWVLSCLRRELG